MKLDFYSKAIFTVIAACLVLIVLQNMGFPSQAYADDNATGSFGLVPLNEDGSINVVITDISPNEMIDVNIKDISTYDELKVNVTNIDTYDELKVNISKISTSDELPVNIDEIGGSSVSSGGPIRVKSD